MGRLYFRPCSVLSFDDAIVLDEEGDCYLFTLADVDEGGCGPADAVEPYHFIVKLNDEQVNIIKNKTNIVANFIDDRYNKALEDLYCFLNFISEDFFKKMNLKDEEFIGKVYVYLNKLN